MLAHSGSEVDQIICNTLYLCLWSDEQLQAMLTRFQSDNCWYKALLLPIRSCLICNILLIG